MLEGKKPSADSAASSRYSVDPNDPIVIVCVGRPRPLYWDPCFGGGLQTMCPVGSSCDTGYTDAEMWALPDRAIDDIRTSIKKLVDDGFRVNIRVPSSLANRYYNELRYTPGRPNP